MHPWIDDNQSFKEFCKSIPAGQPVALDTEFAWTKTYFPVFALLQIGLDREHAALVDALAITDWSPLAEILTDASRRKICFSAGNDLPILCRACGGILPNHVFDVQIAAGFCGESSTQSLKAVIEGHLNISLAKSETRSDWTVRPLTPKQLEYAADDVVLLPELAEFFQRKLEENGNLAWFQEEMNTLYCREDAYQLPPVEDAWKRLGAIRRITEAAVRRRAIALAIWREATAREKNLARPRLLSDEQLLWCAYEAPASQEQLFHMPDCWPKRIRPIAEELLAVIANPPAEPPQPKEVFLPREKLNALVKRIQGLIQKRAQERGIDPAMVGSRHDAEHSAACRLQSKPDSGRLTQGWRGKLMQDALKLLG